MKKNSNWGGLYPKATLFLAGVGAPQVCGRTYTSRALDQTLFKYDFTCTTSQAVTVTTSDRFSLDISVELTPGPGNHSTKAEIDIEGTAGGNYDSLVTIPNPVPTPTITSLSATSGPVGSTVTVNGSNFGSSGTLKFNTTTAAPTQWSATSITAPVPAGATSGLVSVNVNGAPPSACPGNNCTFTVVGPPTLTLLSPATAHRTDSVTITGTNFLSSQGTSSVIFGGVSASPTAWADTSITVPVPVTATSGNVAVTVWGNQSNVLPFTVIPPPTLTIAAPLSARRGDPVTIFGTDFGAAQGRTQ